MGRSACCGSGPRPRKRPPAEAASIHLRSYLGWQGAGGGSFLLQCTDPVTVSTVPRAAVYALTYVNTSPSDPAPPLTVSSSLMLNSRISLVMSFPCFKGGIIPSCTSGTQRHGKSFSAVYWLCDTHHHFKIGHCDFQIRPLRVELGQYRNCGGCFEYQCIRNTDFWRDKTLPLLGF
jgi:hypothetical protein